MEQFKLNWTGAEVNDAITRINNLFDLIYPVGSIYMSTNDTSPATLFGGTWVQIKDTFLLACGDTYANAATGGEATHTLTTAEMPSHKHTISTNANFTVGNCGGAGSSGIPQASGWGSYGNAHWFTITVNNTGSDGAHNNMPPYLAVYVWKRTA